MALAGVSLPIGSLCGMGRIHARKRGISWELTIEQVGRLRATNACHYCKSSLPRTIAGLDRIDNALGYSVKNCVASCGQCNRERGTLAYDEWLLVLKSRRYRWARAMRDYWIWLRSLRAVAACR